MELANVDIIKILGYGLSGFAFLLVFLAFMLLRKEQDKPEPRKMIVQTIWMFMGLCLTLSLVVGLLSIPIINSNNEKEKAIAKLTSNLSVNRKADSIDASLDKLSIRLAQLQKIDTNSIVAAEKDIAGSFTEIEDELNTNQPDNKDALQKVQTTKAQVTQDLGKLKDPNQNKDTLKAAMARIQIRTNAVKMLSFPIKPLVDPEAKTP
ncbi:MAG: hypothetical protein JNL57_03995 [Bacteroidetes bacterium]|nr:hypothetical protein [Bacteroidota bacterium]